MANCRIEYALELTGIMPLIPPCASAVIYNAIARGNATSTILELAKPFGISAFAAEALASLVMIVPTAKCNGLAAMLSSLTGGTGKRLRKLLNDTNVTAAVKDRGMEAQYEEAVGAASVVFGEMDLKPLIRLLINFTEN